MKATRKTTKKSTTKSLPIRRVCVVHKNDHSASQILAAEVSDWLKERKIKVFSHPQQKIRGAKRLSRATPIDLVVVLGGDGTYLEAVRMLKGEKTPILGVNMGSLGFLTETRLEDLYSTLPLALANKLDRRRRSMLHVSLKRQGRSKAEFTALNDVVIERGPLSHLIHLNLQIEKNRVYGFKADGAIIATPTGSTAYNLAAGGPILHPEVQAFVVTPVCSHSLTNRPLIFPDDKVLTFRLKDKGQKAFITVDGKTLGELTSQDELTCVRSHCDHFVLRKPTHNYFDLLREKLRFGERN